MSSTARDRIFSRLHSAPLTPETDSGVAADPAPAGLGRAEKIDRLKTLMEAMRTEVHVVAKEKWEEHLKDLLRQRKFKNLLISPNTPLGEALATGWDEDGDELPELTFYEEDVDAFKEALFQTEASITGTNGGIADPGAIILWPTPLEPRLMSLVPPVHIAVLEADKIYSTLAEAVEKGGWAGQMPTNTLLISGPSKTADIEFQLVFGVHGPKELIVLVLT